MSELDKALETYFLTKKKEDPFFDLNSLSTLPSETLFADMEKSLSRVKKAIDEKENILVFGHDDADGICAAYILYDFLITLSDQIFYFIPNRTLENHGIRQSVIDYAKDKHISLLISVDNGISSNEGVDLLNQQNTETIIIDHHLVPENMPNAFSIINPKRSDCDYPYNMLAGVGVVYMFLRAFSIKYHHTLNPEYLFWTVIGTMADRVPLTQINRLFIKSLLHNWNSFCSFDNIRFLLSKTKALSFDQEKMTFLEEIQMLFIFGRESNGQHKCFSFLIAKSLEKEQIYQELLNLKIENHRLTELNDQIIQAKVIDFLYQRELNQGLNTFNNELYVYFKDKMYQSLIYIDHKKELSYTLIGRLASRLSSLYQIPVMILHFKDDMHLLGEARCQEGFHWLNCFNHCAECFLNYGGHVKAAGFFMEKTKLDKLINLYFSYLETIKLTIPDMKNQVDIEIDTETQTFSKILQFQNSLLPFGEAHNRPIFKLNNYKINPDDLCYFENNNSKLLKIFKTQNTYDLLVTYANDIARLRLISYNFRNGENHDC